MKVEKGRGPTEVGHETKSHLINKYILKRSFLARGGSLSVCLSVCARTSTLLNSWYWKLKDSFLSQPSCSSGLDRARQAWRLLWIWTHNAQCPPCAFVSLLSPRSDRSLGGDHGPVNSKPIVKSPLSCPLPVYLCQENNISPWPALDGGRESWRGWEKKGRVLNECVQGLVSDHWN